MGNGVATVLRRCISGVYTVLLRCASGNLLICSNLRRLRKPPCAALRHEPTPAQSRNLPYHSVLRRLAGRAGCRPAGRGRSPCQIESSPSPCTIHASWCSLAAAPFPSPPLEERGRERRSSFPASTPEIWVRQAAEISPRTAASSGGNGPPLPGPLLQRRRGRAAPPLFASARCV